MNYLIDTNICIYLMNRRPSELLYKLVSKFKQMDLGQIAISSITVAELQFGVAKSINKTKNQLRLDEFLFPFTILPFTQWHTTHYGRLRASLAQKGQVIGSLDMLIAAHALAENRILVTNNDKEFVRVEGLSVENWLY